MGREGTEIRLGELREIGCNSSVKNSCYCHNYLRDVFGSAIGDSVTIRRRMRELAYFNFFRGSVRNVRKWTRRALRPQLLHEF
jgi:hypothetical protein